MADDKPQPMEIDARENVTSIPPAAAPAAAAPATVAAVDPNLERAELTPEEEKRLAALDKMTAVEQQFASQKEKHFAAKVAAIQAEIALVEAGKHEQYLAKEQQQQQKYREALELAARERAYQIRNAQIVYEAEVAQAEKDLVLDRKHLKKKLLEALEQKLEDIDEEKRNITVVDTKKSVREEEAHAGGPKKKKPKQEVAASTYVEGRKRRVNPPHVNYTVRETDTFQDLNLIKRNIPRAQLESILYDVYASGNDTLVYYEKQFDVGQPCIITDRDGAPQYSGVVEVVSPVEVKIKTKTGTVQSLELARLRVGDVCLQKP